MKLALICAHPSGTNHGMISVDMAFQTIKESLGEEVEVTRFCSWRDLSKGDSLNYNHYYSVDQLKNYDKIIFWGDFLQWLGYAKNDWLDKSASMDMKMSNDELIDMWYSLFLFEHSPSLRKKTILFGGTIYGINSNHISDFRYLNSLTNLVQDAILVKSRDVLSANFVSQLAPVKTDTFGCDCALLMKPNIIAYSEKSYFLYSFARSGNNKLELEKISNMLAIYTGIEARPIPWIAKGASENSLSRNIKLINDASFVITDIYHLAVNSWRESIPAICIGHGASTINNTLSDKKKEIFYHQMFGIDYYIFLEDLLQQLSDLDNSNELLIKISNLVKDKHKISSILKFLKLQRDRSIDQLILAINS